MRPGSPAKHGGVRKDVIVVPVKKQVEVGFTADNPGPTLLHCHQPLHLDYGFMTMLQYRVQRVGSASLLCESGSLSTDEVLAGISTRNTDPLPISLFTAMDPL